MNNILEVCVLTAEIAVGETAVKRGDTQPAASTMEIGED